METELVEQDTSGPHQSKSAHGQTTAGQIGCETSLLACQDTSLSFHNAYSTAVVTADESRDAFLYTSRRTHRTIWNGVAACNLLLASVTAVQLCAAKCSLVLQISAQLWARVQLLLVLEVRRLQQESHGAAPEQQHHRYMLETLYWKSMRFHLALPWTALTSVKVVRVLV